MKTKTLLLALACLLPVCVNAQEKTVDLKIELPPVVLTGTPVPIKIQNLEPARKGSREVLKVPEGTTNLALNKPVTSSDKSPIVGELSYITDGDKDGDEGYEVELMPGVQWVQIDLQKESNIYAICVWHYHRQKRAYRSVVVQISNDPAFKTGVTTVFNTDYDNVTKLGEGKDMSYIETNEGKLIPVSNVKGRYVRLYSAGNTTNTGNHYVEVDVYGKVAK
ncbi:MAG: discoidin domain-containing protein [Puniceicoccales bacterium]|jgi:hypothetical protein|nr:discoidin domain-containing protein [Puniceicoccales bacterium]